MDKGVEFCAAELPPKQLDADLKSDACRDYMWEYGLSEWKDMSDYDIRYLNARYPDINIKDIVCGLFLQCNGEDNTNKMPRKYAEGRNFGEELQNRRTGATVEKVHTMYQLVKKEHRDNELVRVTTDDLEDSLSQVTRSSCRSSSNRSTTRAVQDKVDRLDREKVIVHLHRPIANGFELVDSFAFDHLCGYRPIEPRYVERIYSNNIFGTSLTLLHGASRSGVTSMFWAGRKRTSVNSWYIEGEPDTLVT